MLCGALFFAGCATKHPATPSTTAKRAQWTRANVIGLTMTLVDPVRIEWMSFTRDGLVPITIGRKNDNMTAPLFYWKLVSGRLRIIVDDNEIYDELTLISRDTSIIVARRRSGEVVKYKMLEQRSSRGVGGRRLSPSRC